MSRSAATKRKFVRVNDAIGLGCCVLISTDRAETDTRRMAVEGVVSGVVQPGELRLAPLPCPVPWSPDRQYLVQTDSGLFPRTLDQMMIVCL